MQLVIAGQFMTVSSKSGVVKDKETIKSLTATIPSKISRKNTLSLKGPVRSKGDIPFDYIVSFADASEFELCKDVIATMKSIFAGAVASARESLNTTAQGV